ncbi:hypothetical protein BYT27DRAFT_7339865 [Phlegmacium glaucopus]|nr:hypothetical protein BYT27DRAFT_7339865 [Phlegmacium glaucopus]
MSDVTLGDRCSQYRGSTVEFNTYQNLTNPQFVTSTNPKASPPVHNNAPFKRRFGQHPAITPAPGQAAASGFRPAPRVNPNQRSHVHIMVNPNRGGWRGGCQEYRLRRLSSLIIVVVQEAEVLFQDFVVVVASFQGVVEVEGSASRGRGRGSFAVPPLAS